VCQSISAVADTALLCCAVPAGPRPRPPPPHTHRFRHHRPRCQGVRGPLAAYCQRCQLHCLSSRWGARGGGSCLQALAGIWGRPSGRDAQDRDAQQHILVHMSLAMLMSWHVPCGQAAFKGTARHMPRCQQAHPLHAHAVLLPCRMVGWVWRPHSSSRMQQRQLQGTPQQPGS
jgi:hypothetical protein